MGQTAAETRAGDTETGRHRSAAQAEGTGGVSQRRAHPRRLLRHGRGQAFPHERARDESASDPGSRALRHRGRCRPAGGRSAHRPGPAGLSVDRLRHLRALPRGARQPLHGPALGRRPEERRLQRSSADPAFPLSGRRQRRRCTVGRHAGLLGPHDLFRGFEADADSTRRVGSRDGRWRPWVGGDWHVAGARARAHRRCNRPGQV